MAQLPNVGSVILDDAKITKYLLNDAHPQNRGKARFFMRFGFTPANWQELRACQSFGRPSHQTSPRRKPGSISPRHERLGHWLCLRVSRERSNGSRLSPGRRVSGCCVKASIRKASIRIPSHALRNALLDHPHTNPVVGQTTFAYGEMYEVRCAIASPDGRNPCIRSFWAVEPPGANPKFITAYADRP